MNIYRECSKEPYSFLTIDTTLPASDSQRFRKNLLTPLMKLTDELKILDDKIKANQVQYDLSREAAKILALPPKDLLKKYEYLAGEDLGHKPSVFEKINLIILHWVCQLVKHLKKMRLKMLLRARVVLIMIKNILFTDFTNMTMNLKICH